MSSIQTPFQNLMKKEMTRKEFLGAIGMAALIVLNIEPVIRLLTHSSSHEVASEGYDSSPYGGNKPKGSA